MSAEENTMQEQRYDRLELTVERTATGRKIVPNDPSLANFVSANGRTYDDGIWRVTLYEQRLTAIFQEDHRVMILYNGMNVLPEMSRPKKSFGFCTGRLNIELSNELHWDTKKPQSVIRCQIEHCIQSVCQRGVLSGFIYESPNQVWDLRNADIYPSEYQRLYVFSDGKVECHCTDGRNRCMSLVNPSHSAQKIANCGFAVKFSVSDATWTVVCFHNDGDTYKAEATLYTESESMADVLASIDQYLGNMGFSGFDEMLGLQDCQRIRTSRAWRTF